MASVQSIKAQCRKVRASKISGGLLCLYMIEEVERAWRRSIATGEVVLRVP